MTDVPLFFRDFDAELAAEAALREVADQPAPSSEEIESRISEAARLAFEEGRAQGLAEGLAQARGEAASLQASALAGLQEPLAALLEGQRDHAAALEADIGRFLLGLCEKLIPELVDTLGPQRLEAETRAIARRAQGSRRLELRVAPENAAGVGRILAELAGDAEGRELRVIPDPAMGPVAIEAQWHRGRSEHDYARLCRSVAEAISRNLPAGDPAGPRQTDGEK